MFLKRIITENSICDISQWQFYKPFNGKLFQDWGEGRMTFISRWTCILTSIKYQTMGTIQPVGLWGLRLLQLLLVPRCINSLRPSLSNGLFHIPSLFTCCYYKLYIWGKVVISNYLPYSTAFPNMTLPCTI